jgi:hypothetical protein
MKLFRLFAVITLLFGAAQGAWSQTTDETLTGRTLYKDGKWNTLCVPFSLTADQITASPLNGATIKELDNDKSKLSGYELELYFKDATTIDAGKPYIVKWPKYFLIESAADWDKFTVDASVYDVVVLATDITVGNGDIVGTSEKPFTGTFDGAGHTITCNIDLTAAGAAPFQYIKDAHIKNVKMTGTVNGVNHCAGLVGSADGTNLIEHCEVAAIVTCTGTHCGGILGHGQLSSTAINNCLFSGSISGATSYTGIIYGWADGGTQTINNCLANGEYSGGSIDMMLGSGAKNSVDCFKNEAVGSFGNLMSTAKDIDELIAWLGSGWQKKDGKAVPNLTTLETTTIVNPTFSGVTTDNTKSDVSFGGGCFFRGTSTEGVFFNAPDNDKMLLLTGNNTLRYPAAGLTLGKYCAYFELPTAGAARSVTLDFGEGGETTSITLVRGEESQLHGAADYYDLSGRKLVGKPTHRGLYIVNGKKVVIN